MKSFVVERPVESIELDQALTSLQGELGVELPMLDPAVVLFTHRMSQRALEVDAQTEGRAIAGGVGALATHVSPDMHVGVGMMTHLCGATKATAKFLGVHLLSGRQVPNSKDILLDERRSIAGYFGIELQNFEQRKSGLCIPLITTEGVSLKTQKEVLRTWQKMRTAKKLGVTLLGAKFRLTSDG